VLLDGVSRGVNRVPGATECLFPDVGGFSRSAVGAVEVERVASVGDLPGAARQLDRGQQRCSNARSGARLAAARQRRPYFRAPADLHAAIAVRAISRELVQRAARATDQDRSQARVAQVDLGDAAGLRNRAATLGARERRDAYRAQ